MIGTTLRNGLTGLVRERLEALQPLSYRRFVAAVLVTNVGNGMQYIANSWLVLGLTNRPATVPLLLLITALPGILFGPMIGVAIDRFDRRLLYVWTDVTSAGVLALMAGFVITGTIRTWHVFLAVFLLGLSEQIATPTGTTLVREVVPVQRLLAANATNGVALQVGTVIGAAIGGIVIALYSVTPVLLTNLASFLLSALLVVGVRAGQRAPAPDNADGWRATLRRAAMGVDYLRDHSALIPTYLMLLVMFGTLYMLNSLLPPFARDVLGVGAKGLGYIDAMFAVGAIAGGAALPLVTARVSRDGVAAVSVVGLGLLLVCMGTARGLAVPMMLYTGIGLTYQVFYVFRTRVQEQVPLDLQGRVMALLITGVGACRLTVYGVLSIFASTATLRGTYIVAGTALAFLGVVICARTPRWRLRRALLATPVRPAVISSPVGPGDAPSSPQVRSQIDHMEKP